MTLETDRIGSKLWTVNRNALQNQPDILFRNERSVQMLRTENFGKIGMVEIGRSRLAGSCSSTISRSHSDEVTRKRDFGLADQRWRFSASPANGLQAKT
jgi:phosphatidylserine decarboxylase